MGFDVCYRQGVNESTMPVEEAENRPRYTTVRVMGVFVIVMIAVTVMTGLQYRKRDLLERTEAPTAVGDRAFYELSRPVIWTRAIAKMDGKALFLQSDEPVELEDVQMQKVAWWRRFHLYEPRDEPGTYLVKVGKGRYLPLGPERRLSAE